MRSLFTYHYKIIKAIIHLSLTPSKPSYMCYKKEPYCFIWESDVDQKYLFEKGNNVKCKHIALYEWQHSYEHDNI